jgi:hypothetical protein
VGPLDRRVVPGRFPVFMVCSDSPGKQNKGVRK